MSDIVEQLRRGAFGTSASPNFWPDILKAADEIERLRAHIRAQADDIMILGQMIGRCCPVCDRRALERK